VYGEGLGEEMFLKYLRGLYSYNSNTAVTIRNGRGGNAASIVIGADHTPGAFDRKIVVLDNDKGSSEMTQARQEASKRNIELFENTPCLEAVLLSVLNNGAGYASKGSSWCKGEFQSKYIDKKKRMELKEYGRVFPKTVLDTQRKKVKELHRLISLMEGDNS